MCTADQTHLRGYLELLVLLQQLLGVLYARARGGVCGQVELPVVMDPFQSLGREGTKTRSWMNSGEGGPNSRVSRESGKS